MKEKVILKTDFDSHLECFGEFEPEDMLCQQFCALRLRCVVERNRSYRIGLLEELISTEMMDLKIQ
jgi:hypothetical protein